MSLNKIKEFSKRGFPLDVTKRMVIVGEVTEIDDIGFLIHFFSLTRVI
ncbi:Unknown protein sequence [Pseudomonas syringae pv. maculicola]|nr:Unknown protein sequence [Pseudomonas syringae pv. maculicola]